MRRLILLVAIFAAGCGSSPSAPTVVAPVYPNAQGVYQGTYSINACSDPVGALGVCAGAGLTPGAILPLGLSTNQNQSSVSGNMTLGTLGGNFQGTLTTGGTLTGTAVMNNVSLSGTTATVNVTDWFTSVSGSSIAGTFNVRISFVGLSGQVVYSATIRSLTR